MGVRQSGLASEMLVRKAVRIRRPTKRYGSNTSAAHNYGSKRTRIAQHSVENRRFGPPTAAFIQPTVGGHC
jgi:hypothetical protein